MKRKLKWIGIVFLALVAVIGVYAVLGMQSTLALDIGEVNLDAIADGVYTGEYSCYRWSNTVEVTVEDHKIVEIRTVAGPTGRDEIREEMIEQVLAEQTPALDAVSGATADKKAFLKAVENALVNAE